MLGNRTSSGSYFHQNEGHLDTWRFHAFFTTTDRDLADTVAADKTHRGHAIIEQVHADLKNSALAHLPSAKFTANAVSAHVADRRGLQVATQAERALRRVADRTDRQQFGD